MLHENVCCGYSLEVPHWGTSNENPQHTFLWRNKKIIMWYTRLSGTLWLLTDRMIWMNAFAMWDFLTCCYLSFLNSFWSLFCFQSSKSPWLLFIFQVLSIGYDDVVLGDDYNILRSLLKTDCSGKFRLAQDFLGTSTLSAAEVGFWLFLFYYFIICMGTRMLSSAEGGFWQSILWIYRSEQTV